MKKWYGLILFSVLLAGCQDSSHGGMEMADMDHNSMEMIQVDVKVIPELPKIKEQVELIATITQDGVNVKKANEITFEIWKEGQSDDHEKIKGVKKSDGVYAITKTFSQAGTYSVTTHTTAAGMHTMPTKQFKVEAN
ncbi:FixH family protein [Paenibacillus sp. 2RAB27]|uniref:FixH family protein n=1 Tax=Paenibacillus sp. 2RAB27 TaxID=3232991 RepID=UPI003F9D9B51